MLDKQNYMSLTNIFSKVSEADIEEMFAYADKDKDDKISYTEFQVMINPPKPPTEPQPCLPPAPAVKRVTINTGEKDKELVDIIDEGKDKNEVAVNI